MITNILEIQRQTLHFGTCRKSRCMRTHRCAVLVLTIGALVTDILLAVYLRVLRKLEEAIPLGKTEEYTPLEDCEKGIPLVDIEEDTCRIINGKVPSYSACKAFIPAWEGNYIHHRGGLRDTARWG
jgi:hypothetical protein